MARVRRFDAPAIGEVPAAADEGSEDVSDVYDVEGIAVRRANLDDLEAVRRIDDASFPEDEEHAERAAPNELEDGVASGGLLVATTEVDEIVGFVQFGPSGPGHFFLFGTAVAPAYRGRGIARALVAHALNGIQRIDPTSPDIAATTAPSNVAMVRALTQAGFVATTYIDEYFGPGKARLYFVYSPTNGYTKYSSRVLVPASSLQALAHLLDGTRQCIAALHLPHGWHYEVATRIELEEASRLTNEVAVSSAFSAALLASFTFLFGFALAVPTIPSDLLGATGACLLISLFSLVAYTNASGELARLESGGLSRFMQIGNVWSEFGGVYTLFVITPTLVLSVAGISIGAIAISIAATILQLVYNRSPVNIIRRYERSRPFWRTLQWVYTALPITAIPVYLLTAQTWPWTLALALVTVAALMVGRRGADETWHA